MLAPGDWTTLGSAIVAVVALAVSGLTYRQQRATQRMTDEQQLNDLVEKLQQGLADLSRPQGAKGLADLSRPQGTMAFAANAENAAENGAKLAAVLGQAIEAKKLICRSRIHPDWFQSMVLATAFTQAWDPAGALEYWERAVDISDPERQEANRRPDYQAHIRSLAARAEFYYTRGLNNDAEDGDWRKARDDYDAALTLLLTDPAGQGLDPARQQAAFMLVYQAGLELRAGNEPKAVELIIEAFTRAESIGMKWRQREALETVGNLVNWLQFQALPAHNVVMPVAEELRRSGAKFADFPASVVPGFRRKPLA